MSFIFVESKDNIATVKLSRGKVNALNEELLDEFDEQLNRLLMDKSIEAIILTGAGKFFSFGFDIPELIQLSKDNFKRYLVKFTDLYTRLFLFPKPIISAINGHAIAGGCMLASATDWRIMVTGKAKFSLNEITFGASVFSGSVELMKYCVGNKNAEQILLTGDMYTAEQGVALGFVDNISDDQNILSDARKIAEGFASKDSASFTSLKKLLRQPVVDLYKNVEMISVNNFLEIWYSDSTMEQLKKIEIRS